MELRGMNTAVIGMGRTGIATASFLMKRGAGVTCFDRQDRSHIRGLDRIAGTARITDNWDGSSTGSFGLMVVSPGVPLSLKGIVSAKETGAEVISEIELAYRFTDKRIIGITGTNGKSTTVTLLGRILDGAGIKAGIGGNLGTPFIELVDHDSNYELYVLELSSYQLEGIDRFRPWIAGLLNITDDHLDRYRDMNEYAKAKFRIFMNQSVGDYAVINGEDRYTVKAKRSIRAKSYCFTTSRRTRLGAYSRDGSIVFVDGSGNRTGFAIKNPSLAGMHNVQNAMACIIIAKILDIPDDVIRSALEGFRGLAHRIELVTEVNGVRYYDDSKATNVDAVVVALKSFSAPVILIMGGRDKGGDYGPLSELVKSKVKLLIVLGEARDRISEAFRGMVPMRPVDSMEAAVETAHGTAEEGDVVLLSPACSSFDMFLDYKQRGDVFRAAVMREKGGHAQ